MARGKATTKATPGSKAESEAKADSKRRGRGRSATIRRLLAIVAFLPIAGRAPLYARLVWALLADGRTPASRHAQVVPRSVY